MTLVELMSWNSNISFQEYEALLKQREAKQKALRRAQEAVYNEEDALSVLSDEMGSELWQRHEKTRQATLKRVEKLKKNIAEIESAIHR